MDNSALSSFISVASTFSLILIHGYLYVMYRKRYMAVWIASWLGYSLRILLFDSDLMMDWKNPVIVFTIYQLLYNGTILLFLWSVHLFIQKPVNKGWIWGAVCVTAVTAILTILHLPVICKLFFPACFAGIILMHIGALFLKHQEIHGSGRMVIGYSFILWGIQTVCMPIIISVSAVTPWGYISGGILRLLIASGTIMVYFEGIRLDLANRESHYRLLAENAVDIIYRYVFLPEEKLDYISPSVRKITGYTPDECYADTNLLFTKTHFDEFEQFTALLTSSSQADDKAVTFRFLRKDGEFIWLEHKRVPILAEDGRCLAIEGILRDVTARKNLESLTAKLDRLNMAGQMAVSVAHEIRNPLTTVRGYLQMLGGKKETCGKCRERFDWMISELDKACSIISEYLLLSQDKRVDLKACSLNLILADLLPLLQAAAGAAKVQLALELAPAPELCIDESEIRQLVIHLVRNAMEAMPSGGIITIRTATEADRVSLSVSDQGCGLPENILANLGTPFLTTKREGAGLGLPICYQIASRHHATLTANTGSCGTTFFVHFILPSQAA